MRQIKRVKFYQSIELEGAMTSFVVPDLSKASGIKLNKPIIKITRTDYGVSLETSKDYVEVFAANIAYISYENPSEETVVSMPKKVK